MTNTVNTPVLEDYILSHLDQALAENWIKVYLQPVVRCLTRQVCGMEALARWEDPVWGVLEPAKFIPVLETHRRIHELDAYIVRQVCRDYRAVTDQDLVVPVSINLSRLDYELCDIFAVVEEAVTANKMPRGSLCIEITESMLNQNAVIMRQSIDRFRNAGYPVWMDDFGSGYSSLNVLKDYQFDELKIDMIFLSDFHLRSKKILSSIIHMAKQIGIQTLAEGVETETQFQFLRNIGCEKVQGYLFGKPLPYKKCVQNILRQGLTFEPPVLRRYYDDLGRFNVLSPTPFALNSIRRDMPTGKELNSIPLALMEVAGQTVIPLFTNLAFEELTASMDNKRVFGDLHPSEQLEPASLNKMPPHLRRLIEETVAASVGRMYFVDNGEYYELRTQRLARYENRHALLFRMDNLSRGFEVARQDQLDHHLRQIYSIYDRVSLLDLNTQAVTPLYLDGHTESVTLDGNLKEIMIRYAQEWVFPDDRKRYLEFIDPDTLEQRMRESGKSFLNLLIRARVYRGTYFWKCYTLVPVGEGIYYLLIRDADENVRTLRSILGPSPRMSGEVTPDLLLENAVRFSSLKFFWKDANRRFLGASQAFLDYYGFPSLEYILGKTDEDMGWHLHPDTYMGNEWSVIQEGASSQNALGSCIAQGENRNIVASKIPLYNTEGTVVGLLGRFDEIETQPEDWQETRQARIDPLTGLLNSRGLEEDFFLYKDEYELRGKDFARIEVSMEDFFTINRRYGYDFGDKVIRSIAETLVRVCGAAATVGRATGCQFVIYRQFHGHGELGELLNRLHGISSQIREVEGVPFTVYLSVGAAIYSDSENAQELIFQAQIRRMTDDVEGTSHQKLLEKTDQIFRMYEDLPIAYAVYKLLEEQSQDAIILYANRKYCTLTCMTPEQLVGNRISNLFPLETDDWYDMARRAAFLGVEEVRQVYYPITERHMILTANQVIGPGCCAFTYQLLEEK